MKVCIISTSYHPYNTGGGEFSAKQLAEALVGLGHEVFVIAAYNRNCGEEQINGVRVYRIKSPNIYWSGDADEKNKLQKLLWHLIESYNVNVYYRVKPILLKECPDVVHIRNITDFSAYIWKACKRINIPSVTTLNNYASICTKTTLFNHGKVCNERCVSCKIFSYPKKKLSKYANAIIGVSNFTLQEHLRYGLFKNAFTDVIRTQQEFKKINRKSCDGLIKFGFIGQVRENKGVKSLIEAFSSVKSENICLNIAGAGSGDYYKECLRLSRGDRRITFLGKIDSDVFYRSVDIVVIPSIWYEPFPRVLVEAYSYGLPVISTGNGGIKEMILNGETGYLYSTIEELKSIIRKLVQEGLDNIKYEQNIVQYLRMLNKSDIELYASVYSRVTQ